MLLVLAALVCAGCGEPRARHAAVVGIPPGADSAKVTQRYADGRLTIDVYLKLNEAGDSYRGKALLVLCRRSNFTGNGRASRGGQPKLDHDGHARLTIKDSSWARQFVKGGGQCSILVSGSEDVPMLALFGDS
jgi:hypothetical protein